MNEERTPDERTHAAPEEMTAALFANMVVQQTNMALMFLGQVPHPESGKHVRDLDAARMFIDQLEMLEVKTKGNLDKREEALLRQSLTALRMAFVDAANQTLASTAKKDSPGAAAGAASQPAGKSTQSETTPAPEPATPSDETESRKKFSKKY